jgi:hypothetical protein
MVPDGSRTGLSRDAKALKAGNVGPSYLFIRLLI